MKNQNYISWDEYFIGIVYLSAMRSKDPNTQVGACIVDKNNKIVGIGYNGFPAGCSDDILPWCREGNDNKYLYVVHAEINAILNSSLKLNDCKLYVSLFPCCECAKLIIQSGIKTVIYLDDFYKSTQSIIAAKRMFDLAGIQYTQYILSPNSPLMMMKNYFKK